MKLPNVPGAVKGSLRNNHSTFVGEGARGDELSQKTCLPPYTMLDLERPHQFLMWTFFYAAKEKLYEGSSAQCR